MSLETVLTTLATIGVIKCIGWVFGLLRCARTGSYITESHTQELYEPLFSLDNDILTIMSSRVSKLEETIKTLESEMKYIKSLHGTGR